MIILKLFLTVFKIFLIDKKIILYFYILNDSPQPQELFSLGLLNIKRDAILSDA